MGFILWAPAFRVLVVEVHMSQKKKNLSETKTSERIRVTDSWRLGLYVT